MTKENWQAEYLKAIGANLRIKIINYVAKDWKNFIDILKEINIHRSTLSKHLKILYVVGIVDRKQVGPITSYKLLDSNVLKILKLIP